MSTFSVIIPTLKEERHVGALLSDVASVRTLRMVLACCLASSARLSKRAAALLDGLEAGGPVAEGP